MPALQVPWKRAARSRQVEKSSTAVAGDTVLKHGLEVAMLKTVTDGFGRSTRRQQDFKDEASQTTIQAVRRGVPHDVDHALAHLVRPLLERGRERPRHRLAIAPARIERGREPDGRRGNHRVRRAQGRVSDPIPADRRADAGRVPQTLRAGALSCVLPLPVNVTALSRRRVDGVLASVLLPLQISRS